MWYWQIPLHLAIFVFFAVFMELFAWFTHKYIMHGLLWIWHKDHHVPHKGFWEKNDIFVLLFATPAAAAIILGIHFGQPYVVTAGLGITAYGLGYVLFHDVMFHRRVKGSTLHRLALRYEYFASIVHAHRMHHKHTNQFDTESFGFLYAPKRYRVKLDKTNPKT